MKEIDLFTLKRHETRTFCGAPIARVDNFTDAKTVTVKSSRDSDSKVG